MWQFREYRNNIKTLNIKTTIKFLPFWADKLICNIKSVSSFIEIYLIFCVQSFKVSSKYLLCTNKFGKFLNS